MGSCTIWPPAVKRWFDSKFGDLCDDHDAEYVKRVWRDKWVADLVMAYGFMTRGAVTIAYLSLAYNFILGTIYWTWKKYKPKRK